MSGKALRRPTEVDEVLRGFMVNWQERARQRSAVAADVMKEGPVSTSAVGSRATAWIVHTSSCIFFFFGLPVGESVHQIPIGG
jgi:hypothetical protein